MKAMIVLMVYMIPWKQTALISKWAGGIGLHIHNVRRDGTLRGNRTEQVMG